MIYIRLILLTIIFQFYLNNNIESVDVNNKADINSVFSKRQEMLYSNFISEIDSNLYSNYLQIYSNVKSLEHFREIEFTPNYLALGYCGITDLCKLDVIEFDSLINTYSNKGICINTIEYDSTNFLFCSHYNGAIIRIPELSKELCDNLSIDNNINNYKIIVFNYGATNGFTIKAKQKYSIKDKKCSYSSGVFINNEKSILIFWLKIINNCICK